MAKWLWANGSLKTSHEQILKYRKVGLPKGLLLTIDELASAGTHVRSFLTQKSYFFLQRASGEPVIVVKELRVLPPSFI
jgi:hypothetical protein